MVTGVTTALTVDQWARPTRLAAWDVRILAAHL